MFRRILAAALGLALTGSVASAAYLQSFDGAPPAPLAYPALAAVSDWDVVVHSDNTNPLTWLQVPGNAMQAHHSDTCGAPPATHLMNSYSGAVFQCANHLMTSVFGDGGYAAIYLTPPQMLDWSSGSATLSWDVSTLRTSQRDWWDVWLTPWADRIQMPLEDWLPDLQGPPANALHLRMDNNPNGSTFRALPVANFVTTELADNACCVAYEQVLIPDAARRDHFELVMTPTHVKYWMPAYNLVFVDTDWTAPFTQAVVQFGHHSYNPLKDCLTCSPDTWHWDNVSLSPSVPFTITRASERAADYTTPTPTFHFPTPASGPAMIQAAAFTGSLDYSLDGGTTWATFPQQAVNKHDTSHAASYGVAVPAGTSQVTVRGAGGYWGPQWLVQDVALYQIDAPRPRTPTPTSVPPTVTPSPTPVPTVTPGPTSTPPPSLTPPPTPTGTPVPLTVTPGPHCGRVDLINGGLMWTPLDNAQCMQG